MEVAFLFLLKQTNLDLVSIFDINLLNQKNSTFQSIKF
jgi:hypothetical protein